MILLYLITPITMALCGAYFMAAWAAFKVVELEEEESTELEGLYQSDNLKKFSTLKVFLGKRGSATLVNFFIVIVLHWKKSKEGRKFFYIGTVFAVLTWLIFQI